MSQKNNEIKRPQSRPGGRGPMRVNLDKAKDSKATTKRLLNYLKGSKKQLIIVYIFIILSVILNLAQSVVLYCSFIKESRSN